MWRQDIAEEKQAQPQMARGCLCLSINAKQTTSLGKEDISLFISFLSLSLSLSFSGLTLILKAEGSGRGGVTQDEKDTGRGREREKKGREEQMKSIFEMPETSGFIFGIDLKGNCK